MITLAIDTSHLVAVGLHLGDDHRSLVIDDPRAHVEQLTPAIQRILADAGLRLTDVDRYVVGMGPGPFTGLRAGIATAFTLAHVADAECLRVCSLDALALTVDEEHCIVASDARRQELYWARYERGQRAGEPQVSAPNELPDLPVYGAIPQAFRAEIRFAGERLLDPGLMAARADELPQAPAEPYYLRGADATVPGAPKSALPRLKVRR